MTALTVIGIGISLILIGIGIELSYIRKAIEKLTEK